MPGGLGAAAKNLPQTHALFVNSAGLPEGCRHPGYATCTAGSAPSPALAFAHRAMSSPSSAR